MTRPTPTRLKIVRGNPGRRPLPKAEAVVPPATDLTPPAWLSERARTYWGEIAPMMAECGLLTNVDKTAFEGLCDAYARWREASEMLAKTPLIVKAPTSGYLMPNPMISIANQAFGQLRTMLGEFGMTPSARSRVNANPDAQKPKPENPAAEFFAS